MAGQSMERREVLRILALASSASRFAGFNLWVFAHDAEHGEPQTRKPEAESKPYQPQFFSPKEYRTVARLAELIIPSDTTPGAKEAGVSEFIDFMAASDEAIQFRSRQGLTWLDAHAMRLFNLPFIDLAANRQTEILEHLAYKQRHRRGEELGRSFFRLVRDYTVMGFYTSRIGLEQLDYPGLKQYYAELPGCPHAGDPEHRRLSTSRR